MTVALGKIVFSDTPDVNGADLIATDTLSSYVTPLVTNLVVPGTEGITLPNGTTAQRPTVPQAGESRFNTSTGLPEIYAQGTWLPYARVIQSVAGTIGSFSTTAVAPKTTTTIPLTGDAGIQIWTQSFTPLVSGSSLVIQYVVTGYLSVAARAMYNAAFVGGTCVGMTTAATPAVAAAVALGTVNLVMQAVYTTTSTAAVTVLARVGHLNATAGNTATVGVNQSLTTGNYGAAMQTEYRILEII